MTTLKGSLLSAALLGCLALAGCEGHAFVTYGAPPPRPGVVGIVGVAPGPGYVWTDGFWNLSGGRWVWSPGVWRRPPRRGAVWVAPRWERRGRNYRFRRGHWR